jgi:hypothetical protein
MAFFTCSYGSDRSEDNRIGQNARESVKSKEGGWGEKEKYWKYCVCAKQAALCGSG